MEQKINIAEILKDCPKGMELDCILFNNPVKYDGIDIDDAYPIKILTENDEYFYFTKEGYLYHVLNSKCLIFPKGKTTWEGFVPPCKFKDGDVLVHTQNGRFIMSIYKSNENEKLINTHVIFWDREEGLSVGMQICCYTDNVRFTTKEEKAKLFDAIKANGYKWNPYTKTLERLIEPKFKVGNVIQDKDGYKVRITDVSIEDGCYGYESLAVNGIGGISFNSQDDWELVPNKFDITTLKPFDMVLMRSSNAREWVATFYSHYSNNYFFGCGMMCQQCIPYEGNEHLRGTTNDCDEYYKTW